jgi:hypothetical protein
VPEVGELLAEELDDREESYVEEVASRFVRLQDHLKSTGKKRHG